MAEVHHHPTEKGGPSTSQILSVVALFPIGGVLLTLSGLILAGTLIGLAFSAPLLVIFSPILVPAVLTLALSVAGFLTAGAFGVTALSSVLWLLNYVRRMSERSPQLVQGKAGYMGRMRS